MPRQPVASGKNQFGLLGSGDAGCRATEAAARTQPYLDEYRVCAFVADEVDFAATHAEVAFRHPQATTFEIMSGAVFAGIALGLGASHAARMPAMSPDDKTPLPPATLFVVATPIGNLADISARALDVLGRVDVITCEDTRSSRPLLDHYGIRAALLPLHEHNEREAAVKVIALLGEGKRVALISDAGTPGISDPGARAVAAVRAAGFRIVPLPGPSAMATALSAGGINDAQVLFAGFLSPKPGARRAEIEKFKAVPATLVFYEAPHRIEETLADLAALLEPERTLVVARELTKLFEQITAMPVADGPAWLAADANHKRGEFVLIVSAPPPREGLDAETERVLSLLLAELPTKQAAKLAAEITGQPKNALYQRALELKDL